MEMVTKIIMVMVMAIVVTIISFKDLFKMARELRYVLGPFLFLISHYFSLKMKQIVHLNINKLLDGSAKLKPELNSLHYLL